MGPKTIPPLCKTLPPDFAYSTEERTFWPAAISGEAANIRMITDQTQFTCSGKEIHETHAHFKDRSDIELSPEKAKAFLKDLESGIIPQFNQAALENRAIILSKIVTATAAHEPVTLSTEDHRAIPVLMHTVAQTQLGPIIRQQEVDQWKFHFLGPQNTSLSLKIDGKLWQRGNISNPFFITGQENPYFIFDINFNAGLQNEGQFNPHDVEVKLLPVADAMRIITLQERLDKAMAAPDMVDADEIEALQAAQQEALKTAAGNQVSFKAGKLLKMQDPQNRCKIDEPACDYEDGKKICKG